MSTVIPLTSPLEFVFGADESFKIIIEALASPIWDFSRFVEYSVRYQACDLGITADITSEAWASDFKALREALQGLLNEFRPGSRLTVDFTHGVFSITIEMTINGWLDLRVLLTPEPSSPTAFTFHVQVQQEEAKRLIREIDELLSGKLVQGNF